MSQIDRRQAIVLGLAAGATGATAAARAAKRSPAISRRLPDIVVVGAGAFGGWTALRLRELGARVTLVDAYGPGNPHASSGGESRNIQFAYGDKDLYVRWARAAWDAWQRRQEEFGRHLLFPSGSLRSRAKAELAVHARTFDRMGLPYELLSGDEVRKRWPHIRYEDDETCFYEKNSGTVKARDSMIAVSEFLVRKGGTIRIGHAVPGMARNGRLETVLVNGEPLSAGRFVFACGPWFPKLMRQLLGDRIKVPRRELFFIAPGLGDERFRWENSPYLSDPTVYSSADIGGGYKVAPSMRGVPMDPDDGSRLPTLSQLEQVHAFVARRLPGLIGRPVLQSYVCQLERTDNDHFIVDQHPDFTNAWIAGGGSGHAFKMGPILGDHVADLVLNEQKDAEANALFALAAHGAVADGQGW